MSIAFRAKGSAVTFGASPRTIATTGIMAGDLVLLQVNNANAVTPTVGDGFVLVDEVTGTDGIRVYYKIAGGSEPANYTVSWSGGGLGAVDWIAHYSTTALALGIDDYANQTNASGGRICPSVNAATAGEMLLCFASLDVAATSTPHAGMTERWDAGSPPAYCMTELLASSGATGTRTATGLSAASKTISVTIMEGPPLAPDSLTATPITATRIDLAWADNSATEDGYKVDRSANGSTGWSEIADIAADSTSYSDTSVTEHSTWYYRVYAYSDLGDSGFSNTANATTIIIAPTNLTATAVSSSQIDLAWDDNSGVEDGYKIERSANGSTGWSQIGTAAANAEAYSDNGLDDNATWHYRVRAYDGSDNSAYTSVANATTELAAPSGLTLTALSFSRVRLNWTDESDDADGVKVERSLTGVGAWSEIASVAAGVETYTDTGRTALVEYFYRLRSFKD